MKIVKTVSKKTINNPLSYKHICTKQKLAEFKKPSEIAGNRSYILKNNLLLLEQALVTHVLNKLQKKGFEIISAPSLIGENALWGSGYFPNKKKDHFKLDEKRFLASTSEIFINSLHSNETIEKNLLPLCYGAISKCYRTEYENHSRGSKGLIRVHEFTKIEQFVVCKNSAAESAEWHDKLLRTAEEIVIELELPYRIVEFDKEKGPGKVLMHDIQIWFPSESKYRETHSCSTYHDWQTKKTNTKHSGSSFCHTNNCTAIASPRILAAIIENHQTPNKNVKIPKILRSYFRNEQWI